MDRVQVYRGEIPYESDWLNTQQWAYEALGLFALDVLGATTAVAGLACNPTSPASLSVTVGPGRIYQKLSLDTAPIGQVGGIGGLGADTNADHKILKQGLNRDTQTFTFTAPGGAGQSIVYLIQAQFQEVDDASTLLQFYNPADPNSPLSQSMSPARRNKCLLSVKAGTAATTGTQVAPAPDAGWVAVWDITVANGQTTITSGNIAADSAAVFVATGGGGSSPAGNFIAPQQLIFTGKSSPSSVSGVLNDYSPSGWSTAAVLQLGTSGAVQWNGLVGGVDGRVALLMNTGTAPAVLTNNNTGSAAANRFLLPGATYTIAPASGVFAQYDGTAQRWRILASGRDVLRANRTYYVSTTGNDSNDGLSSGTPFLTGQAAVNAALACDFDGFTVTIQHAAGSYAGTIVIPGPALGQKTANQLVIQGDLVTPSNVVFNNNATGIVDVVQAAYGGMCFLQGIKFNNNAAGLASLAAAYDGRIEFTNVEFGTANYHVYVKPKGSVVAKGSYTISGSAAAHIEVESNSVFRYDPSAVTVTLTGTPAFSTAFAVAQTCASIEAISVTFSGSATGPRYSAVTNGVITTNGGGASYLPGNSAGSTATGGQYA